jgi:hypothetical protein
MDSTLKALTQLVGQKKAPKRGVFGPAPPRKRTRPVGPHPSDASRQAGFQRALDANRLKAPRRSAPRPPY